MSNEIKVVEAVEREELPEHMTEVVIGETVIRVAKDAVVEVEHVKEFTPLAFMELFTQSEQQAIVAAAKVNAAIDLFWKKLKMSPVIRMDDPRTIGGVRALEFAGLIAPGRADEILGVAA